MRNPFRHRPGQKGFALITVFWAVMLLAVIAGGFTLSVRTDSELSRNVVDNAKAQALADAGVYRAIPALAGGGETPWRADGTLYEFPFAGGEVSISVQDEAGKLDLNRARRDLIDGLFVAVGLDADRSAALTDAVMDWRDADDLRRLNGAEDADYRDAGLDYRAKDGPFNTVEELQQVLGMTRDIYEAVAPFFSVHSRQRRVDATVAPREVLLAIPGVDPGQVDAALANRGGATPALPAPYAELRQYVSRSRRQVCAIRAEARTVTGAVFVREAVVRLAPGADPPYRFLTWRQGTRPSPEVTPAAADGGAD